MDWAKTTARRDEKYICFGIGCVLYEKIDGRSRWWLGACWVSSHYHNYLNQYWLVIWVIRKESVISKSKCRRLLPRKYIWKYHLLNFKQFVPSLTHRSQDKMANTLQTTSSKAFSWMKIVTFWFSFHWKLLKGPVKNDPSLVQILAWRRTGGKPLSEPVMA